MSRKYGFIDAERANYPVTKMCEWIGVSRSGFHEWRDRTASATAQRQEQLKVLIAHIFADYDGTPTATAACTPSSSAGAWTPAMSWSVG